ncbi:MAG: hypothetical protein JWN45_3237 [Acidobacteriaceae bacterium]|nr:hypothetical protein [Acidobacteriaceae bacterium]
MGLPSLSNPDFFKKIRRKLKSYTRWLKRVPEGLFVMTPIAIPLFGSSLARVVNRLLLRVQMRMALKSCNMQDPVVWVAIPTAADIAECLRPKVLLYQISDKYDANEDSVLSRDVIRDLDQRLKQMADVVLYSGRKLYEEAQEEHRYFLEQAVDFEHFATPSVEIAPEVADIPHPVLGYFGAMDHVMDVQLMAEVARRRPHWHWVMLGTKSNAIQLKFSNIHFLGAKPYSDLPKYVGKFDVCVLPWRANNAFTSYGSAIKVREYLATGKPVVIAPLPEYRDTPGLRRYTTTEEFIQQVEEALANDSEADRRFRQSVVRDATWDTRARQLGDVIAALLAKRESQSARP